LEALIRERENVRLRKIDIVSWESPVARQFNIRRLPTLMLYDGRQLLSADTREILEILGG
jgi:hypothetical protein